MAFYLGLLHYPVYNKSGDIIASAITSVDVHDLARLAKTYGAEGLYIINPLEDQRELAKRVCSFWMSDYGARYNKDRKAAISLVSVVPNLEACLRDIRQKENGALVLISTDARKKKGARIDYKSARELVGSGKAVTILFGTAWGIADIIFKKADYILDPIYGVADYNHLSVRTAAAITLDRLFSRDAIN